uniref:Uncharacterized protein n=1 Tax=Oryza sativa subsp. japonica TaxID=39947 RepID=Q33B00_ORYSJ|nr:hypothetical protein LOC_Os10g06570 [Oryza sativa Japonica Group]
MPYLGQPGTPRIRNPHVSPMGVNDHGRSSNQTSRSHDTACVLNDPDGATASGETYLPSSPYHPFKSIIFHQPLFNIIRLNLRFLLHVLRNI